MLQWFLLILEVKPEGTNIKNQDVTDSKNINQSTDLPITSTCYQLGSATTWGGDTKDHYTWHREQSDEAL